MCVRARPRASLPARWECRSRLNRICMSAKSARIGVGRTIHLLAAPDYDPNRPWAWKPEDGESYEEVQARVGPILDRLAKTHPGDDIVIVSHGGVMMTLWAYVTGEWDGAHAPPNCGIVLIEHGPLGFSPPVDHRRCGQRIRRGGLARVRLSGLIGLRGCFLGGFVQPARRHCCSSPRSMGLDK